MFTKTLWKNARRDIAQSKRRFFAIFLIAFLGAFTFAGMRAIGPDMRRTADSYYSSSNLMDYRLLSTVGFTEDDIRSLRTQAYVGGVMPSQWADVLLTLPEGGESAVRIHTVPKDTSNKNADYINRLTLLEGRLPAAAGECVIGNMSFNNGLSLKPGDRLVLPESNEALTLERLTVRSFTIVGIVESPLYISNFVGNTNVGTGSLSNYLYVSEKAFDVPVYTELFVTLKDTAGVSAFSSRYTQLSEEYEAQLKLLGSKRSSSWKSDTLANSTDKLRESEEQLAQERAKAEEELQRAEKELTLAEGKLYAAQQQITEGRSKIEAQKKELAAKESELSATREKLDEAWRAWNAQAEQLAKLRAAYAANPAAFSPEQLAQLEQGEAALAGTKAQLDAQEAAYQVGKQQAANAQAKIAEATSELDSAQQKVWGGQAELKGKRSEYNQRKAEAEQALAKAEDEIEDGRSRLKDLQTPAWYVQSRDENSGYAGFASDTDRVGSIATIIPVFFFLVAALVCLTTMTRMVEDQRTQIGTLKALGFNRRRIALKYVFYAAAASLFGSVFGIASGLVVFPSTVWQAYGILYRMPDIKLTGNTQLILLTLAVMVLCTTLPAFFACFGNLRGVPASLMRPKAPKAGKRVLLERIPFIWKRLKFSNKVAVRNLLLNGKRFFLTVFGVFSCTALLLTGFGLRDAINGIAQKQFGSINTYDAAGTLSEASSAKANTSLNLLLKKSGVTACYYQQTPISVQSESVKQLPLSVSLRVAEDGSIANSFTSMHKRGSQKAIDYPKKGEAVLTEKLANKLYLKAGDTFTITTQRRDGTDQTTQLKVAGIMENYVYHVVYISAESYSSAFGSVPEYKAVNLKFPELEDEARSELLSSIVDDEQVLGALDMKTIEAHVDDMLSSLNSIVWLILISAAALCFVVLYNLTNINLVERTREIATLKVLGFYEKEVRRYIFRENRVLTWLGIALGLVGGVFLAAYVISTAEVDDVMFRRTIQPLSYAYAVAFTLLSSVLVNLVTRRHLRKIDMIDSLKSAE
ncbi:MAG: ABC transporter permease [Oscillospiraceae bacterium]|jgi:putative ABC transport system permease protein|nr:ABC transporter permease [Oscillospiraceae bacterium]